VLTAGAVNRLFSASLQKPKKKSKSSKSSNILNTAFSFSYLSLSTFSIGNRLQLPILGVF